MDGLWGGYIITVRSGEKIYRLTTKVGVKGFNIPVTVSELNGLWYASHNGRKIEITEVVELIQSAENERN